MSQNVNVHERTLEARHRLRPTNRMQETLERPIVPWWREYFKWEHLTVAGRVIEKGWVVPQPLGIALLLVILGGVGGLYWRIIDKQAAMDASFTTKMQEQRDILIDLKARMDERTNVQKEAESERKREQKDNEEIAKVWRETMSQRMDRIEKR